MELRDFNIIVIPVCTYVKKDGEGVILKGFPTKFANEYKTLGKDIGKYLTTKGPKVETIGMHVNSYVLMFPIKEGWYGPIDLDLLLKSAKELMRLTTPRYTVLFPRLVKEGWEEIKEQLNIVFDERITYYEE